MKKDVLSGWIKEMVSLVFIQTIQAFLLAIVMSVIIATAVGGTGSTSDDISAVGVISIIALTAISKLETLVKKIFGLDSGVVDHSMKGGLASLAGTMVAAKMAGKVLNNVPLVAGGAKDLIKGGRLDKLAAQKKFARNINALKPKGANSGNSGTEQFNNSALDSGGYSNGSSAVDSALADKQSEYVKNMMTAKQNGDVYGYHTNANKALELKRARAGGTPISGGFQTAGGINSATSTGSGGPSGASFGDINSEKLLKLQEKYDEEISKANEKRKEGVKKMLTGLSQTAGAIGGASLGATFGLATGENILKSTGTGMGIGDTLGDFTIKGLSGATSGISGAINYIPNNIKAKKDTYDEFNKLTQDINGDIYKAKKYKERQKDARDVIKRIEKEANIKIDAGNL
jgi:hypothetical protein